MKQGMVNFWGKASSEFPPNARFLCDKAPVTGAVLRDKIKDTPYIQRCLYTGGDRV
jgi:hypothetical protein